MDYMVLLPNLLHLGLTIYIPNNIITDVVGGGSPFFQTSLQRLEFCVAECRAPDLRVEVVTEPLRKTDMVFRNIYVRHLSICVSCNFNIRLVMPQLEKVILTHPKSICNYDMARKKKPTIVKVSAESILPRCSSAVLTI